MGLFGRKKSSGQDEGERYYRMYLDSNKQRLEYLEKSAALGNYHGKAGLGYYYLEHFPDDREKLQEASRLLKEAKAQGAMLDPEKMSLLHMKLGNNK